MNWDFDGILAWYEDGRFPDATLLGIQSPIWSSSKVNIEAVLNIILPWARWDNRTGRLHYVTTSSVCGCRE